MTMFHFLYANDNDAYVPELWAQESLMVLEENMVIGQLVHRDFSNQIASYGDVVNTRKPGEFSAKRKGAFDDVTTQDATAVNVAVPLDQLIHVSFLLYDAEQSKSFKELAAEYVVPAMQAQARFIDQVLLGQYPQFLANGYGIVGGLSSSTAKDYILGARNVMNINKAYESGRAMFWTPDSETELLKLDTFHEADKVGDNGTALRTASLGMKFNWNNFMAQNTPSVGTPDIAATGAINNGSGYARGTVTMTIDNFSAAIPNNSWLSIGGNVCRVVSTVGGATPTSVTVAAPGLYMPVINDAVITRVGLGAVNTGTTYAAGYSKEITYDTSVIPLQPGQIVTFGTDPTSPVYTIIQATSTTILLDRPLESSLANDVAINPGPAGDYNFGFHRNALALVIRPLAAPAAGIGVNSSVVSYNGLSMRATLTYDGVAQATRVTLDMLAGVKVLDEALGVVLFG